jgi:DNA-directed RNA polymerase subunit K/omega
VPGTPGSPHSRFPVAVFPWPGICSEAMPELEISQLESATVDVSATEDAPIVHPKAPPIESRFLYVDVAALRAKQLRRGARPRLDQVEEAVPVSKAVKAERVAMEEVKANLVQWDLPDFKVVVDLR